MNLRSLKNELYRRLRLGATPPQSVELRITSLINEAHEELAAHPSLEHLRMDTIPIAVGSSLGTVTRTSMPPSISRIHRIVDRVNNITLEQVPLRELRDIDPAQAYAGSFPLRYAVVSNMPVQMQPPAASTGGTGLWVQSAIPGDTMNAFVESITQNGGQAPQPAVQGGTPLQGTTRVQIGTNVSHLEITKFYLDAPSTSYVSLYDAVTGGNLLATLPIGITYSRYLACEFWPTPSAATTEWVDCTRRIFDLVNDNDEPIIPPEYHDAILLGTMKREYLRTNDPRYAAMQAEYLKVQDDLISYVMNDPDRIASLRPTKIMWSRLGGQYPSQAWPF